MNKEDTHNEAQTIPAIPVIPEVSTNGHGDGLMDTTLGRTHPSEEYQEGTESVSVEEIRSLLAQDGANDAKENQ